VLLYEGNNVIIVNALGSNGAAGRAEITVNAITNGPSITLISNITSGTPPFTSYFSVSTELPNSAITYQMDFEGDGIIDYTGETFEDINYTYTTEGMYYPTITITDDQGNTYSDTIAVTVLNKAQIDALLKSKWEGMKGALIQSDITRALSYFLTKSKDVYREIFELLAPQLSLLASEMREISLIEVSEDVAEYYVTRPQRETDISYFIYFAKDTNGIWKIDRF
jgi:PKD repeat protein